MVLPYCVVFGTGLGIDHHAMVGKHARRRRRAPARDAGHRAAGRCAAAATARGSPACAPRTAPSTARSLDARRRRPAVEGAVADGARPRGEAAVVHRRGHGRRRRDAAPGPRPRVPRRARAHPRVPVRREPACGCASTCRSAKRRAKDAIKQYVNDAFARFVPEPLRSAMLHSLDEPAAGRLRDALGVDRRRARRQGVALIGDAGGCMHPLTAAGMTNAVHDVLTLADCLGGGGAPDKALLEYQRRRYRFIRAREVFTEALYDVFRAHDDGSKALQAGTFRYWASSPAGAREVDGDSVGRVRQPAHVRLRVRARDGAVDVRGVAAQAARASHRCARCCRRPSSGSSGRSAAWSRRCAAQRNRRLDLNRQDRLNADQNDIRSAHPGLTLVRD